VGGGKRGGRGKWRGAEEEEEEGETNQNLIVSVEDVLLN
jgi:hypothetical protein